MEEVIMKTLDDAVIELNGVLPTNHHESHHLYTNGSKYILGLVCDADRDIAELDEWLFVCSQAQFQQRAKELGFINGYRWGVVYKTDGKRPDLPDDVVIRWFDDRDSRETSCYDLEWDGILSFKITDQCYKPADTSYLEKPAITGIDLADAKDQPVEHIHNPDNGADWWSDDMHKAVSPAPVGTKLIVDCFGVGWKDAVVIGAFDRWNWIDIGGVGLETVDLCRIKPADHVDRKAKAERKKFIDSGFNITDHLRGVFTSDKAAHDVLCALYDAGFRLPGGSK